MLNLNGLKVSNEEILRVAGVPIHIIDRRMKIWRNKASKKIFPNENGTYCYEIIAGKNKVCSDCVVAEVLKHGITQTKERGFKKMVFEVEIVPIFRKPGGTIVGVIETLKDSTAAVVRQQNLEEMAITDELTVIYNRRGIINVFKDEFARTKRYKSMFSIILFDIDNFKPINDKYGHDVGDKVLTRLSSYVKGMMRTADKIGRYGGDEFLVILPETKLEKTLALTRRIEEEISNRELLPGIKVTISVGVTQCLPGDGDTEMIFKRADEEMYKYKNKKL